MHAHRRESCDLICLFHLNTTLQRTMAPSRAAAAAVAAAAGATSA